MRIPILTAGVLCVLGLNGYAQNGSRSTFEDTVRVYEGLFRKEEPLHLVLETDIKHLQRTRRREKYQDAVLTCLVGDTFQVTHPVRIKARGKFRRDECTVPPFWLNIRYAGIEAPELKDVVRMKMVTRCRGARQYEDYVLREYLVYKLYNLVSLYSFNVRLIRLRYVDTGRDNEETEDWAFLIEPQDLLAERLDGKAVKTDNLSIRTVNREVMDLLAMFQYMIGNGDYSVTGRHNMKILAISNSDVAGFVPVPYDFDYTGLVNTHYAIPGEELGIQSVRERYFLGPCRSEAAYRLVLDELSGLRQDFIDLIVEFEYLEEDEKIDMIQYIESFFEEAARDHFIRQEIASTCR